MWGGKEGRVLALVMKSEILVPAPLLAAGFRTAEQNIGVHGFIY